MVNYKISVISYLNSIPFVYGLNSSTIFKSLNLQLDYPSVCADKLIDNVVDIGLVPVVVLKDYPSFKIISEYCIGANGDVDTVCLFSNVPIQDVKKIYLDYQSRTSVELLKILCREYWKITPLFKQSKIGFENNINKNTAALIIGDRAFHANHKYEFVYDLSKYWTKMTGQKNPTLENLIFRGDGRRRRLEEVGANLESMPRKSWEEERRKRQLPTVANEKKNPI